MATFQHILFPTDFSEYSRYARDFAIALTRDFGARLTVLHVMEEPVYPVDVTPFGFSPVEFARERREQVQKLMDQVAEEIRAQGVQPEPVIVEGKAFVQIITVARERGADLIVIGTHGRTGLSHMLMGSVAEKVVRKAACPVLTVRKPGQTFEMP